MKDEQYFFPAYTISNEDLRWATTQIPNSNRVLTTAGSGDQALFYKIAGATHIDTFDFTPYARVIQDIKTTAIQNLTREDYVRLINDLYGARNPEAVKNMPHIMYSMPGASAEILRKHRAPDMFNAGCAACMYPHNLPTDAEYKKLKSEIHEPFKFILSDLAELHAKLTTEYDLINLSNIFDKSYDWKEQVYTLANLIKHVRVGGKIIYLPQYQRFKYSDFLATWKSGAQVAYKNTIVHPQDKSTKIIVFERTR